MSTPPLVAAALLLPALPVSLWVMWSDMARLRIPNRAVLALALGFVLLGLLMVPLGAWTLPDYGWRLLHLPVVLIVGMALNAARAMGAGDAKFLAAAAPYVALDDWRLLLALATGLFLAAFVTHRLARATLGPRLAPDWASWGSGRRFPMGLALGALLLAYLGLAALRP